MIVLFFQDAVPYRSTKVLVSIPTLHNMCLPHVWIGALLSVQRSLHVQTLLLVL